MFLRRSIMTVEDLQRWASILRWTGLAITVVGILITFVSHRIADKLIRVQRLDKQKAQEQTRKSEAELQRVSHLADRTTATVSQLDPRKQPFTSIAADLELTVKGFVQPRKFEGPDVSDMGVIMSLELGKHPNVLSNIWVSRLVASRFSQAGSSFWIHFYMSPMDGLFNAKGMTVGEIEALDALAIRLAFLPDDCEIIKGEVTVTINSSIRRQWLIPPQRPSSPTITCWIHDGYSSSFYTGQGGWIGGDYPIEGLRTQ